METLNLNKIPSGSNPVVHCSQYDIGRTFRFNLFEGSEVVTLDGTEVIECNVRKLDGTIVTVAVTNTSDSYVDVVTTEQMTAVHGSNYGEIVFKKGSDVIGTVNFILQVEKSPLEGGITSDSSIYNLETQIMDIVSVQYDSANVIFDNAGTSGHGIPYTVTSEGIKTMVDDAIALIPEELNDLSDVDITTPTSGEILVYNNGSWENQANPSSTANFAPDYDDTATYNTNDKVIYQGLMYVCLEDSVTGAWDSTKWQNISVADYTAELLPIESGSATNTKSYIDIGLSGKADTGDFIMNLNNNYYSNSTNLQLVVGVRSATFSNGSATIDISAFLGSGYAFISIAFACAKSTSAIAITGAEVSGTTLTVKTTYTGSTSTDISFLAFARKV